MDIQIKNTQELETIDFNFEQIKKELQEKLKQYTGIICTEETIQIAKKDRAELNNIKKQINDKKIEIKNYYMKPYTEFETKMKELMGLVEKPIEAIDKNIKEYENTKKEGKKQIIINFFKANIKNLAEILTIERIWDTKWLNATYKMNDIELEILGQIDRTNNDFKIIEEMKSEFEVQLKDKYIQTLDLGQVMLEKTRLEKQKQIIEEKKKQEELKNSIYQTMSDVADKAIGIKKVKEENAFEKILQQEQKNTVYLKITATNQTLKKLKEFMDNNNIDYEREAL